MLSPPPPAGKITKIAVNLLLHYATIAGFINWAIKKKITEAHTIVRNTVSTIFSTFRTGNLAKNNLSSLYADS